MNVSRMGRPRIQTVRPKTRGWEPTLTQIAERANRLWHHDGCPAVSELGYWLQARAELKKEHREMVAAEDYATRAAAGLENSSTSNRRSNTVRAGALR
jgi:hypothetical protein